MKSTFLALSLVAVPFAAFAGDPPRGHEGHDMGGPGLIKQLDKDNDGRVSRAESAQAATERANKRFDELDANKDGKITRDEMPQGKRMDAQKPVK